MRTFTGIDFWNICHSRIIRPTQLQGSIKTNTQHQQQTGRSNKTTECTVQRNAPTPTAKSLPRTRHIKTRNSLALIVQLIQLNKIFQQKPIGRRLVHPSTQTGMFDG